MKHLLNAFWSEENGQEMVEYTLLVAFFALAGVGVLSGLRTEIVSIWQAISASYATAAS
jgi:Flp pilus assembly pilin Flp